MTPFVTSALMRDGKSSWGGEVQYIYPEARLDFILIKPLIIQYDCILIRKKTKRLHVCMYVCVNINQNVYVESSEPGQITKPGRGLRTGKKVLTRLGWVPFPPLCLADSRLVAQRVHLRLRMHHSATGFGFQGPLELPKQSKALAQARGSKNHVTAFVL